MGSRLRISHETEPLSIADESPVDCARAVLPDRFLTIFAHLRAVCGRLLRVNIRRYGTDFQRLPSFPPTRYAESSQRAASISGGTHHGLALSFRRVLAGLTMTAAAKDVGDIAPDSGVMAIRLSAEHEWKIIRSGDELPATGEFRASPGRPVRWALAGGTIQLAGNPMGSGTPASAACRCNPPSVRAVGRRRRTAPVHDRGPESWLDHFRRIADVVATRRNADVAPHPGPRDVVVGGNTSTDCTDHAGSRGGPDRNDIAAGECRKVDRAAVAAGWHCHRASNSCATGSASATASESSKKQGRCRIRPACPKADKQGAPGQKWHPILEIRYT